MNDQPPTVWIFHGNGARFASGVFSTRAGAEAWIRQHGLAGVLTEYPLDSGAYDWAIQERHFTPKKEHHTSAEFIQRFTSAFQQHEHYLHTEDET